MMKELDQTDRKILSELDKDARISYSELGKRIRVAKETVKYRIAQLEKDGVINGYYTVINFAKLGFTVYRLYIRLQNTNPKIEEEMTDYLRDAKNVSVFYRITGQFHLALGIWARDPWEYEAFWFSFKERFGEYVSSTHLSTMTEYLEFTRSYLLPSKANGKETFATIAKTAIEKLDKVDFALLAFISNNARASLTDIAKKLGVSIVTARYRLRSLIERKVIVGFRPIIDISALGYEYYKVDIWLRDHGRTEEIKAHALSLPNVVYAERTLITSDVEIDLEVQGFDELIRIMDGLRTRFPDDIKEYVYYSRVSNYKTSYIPVV